MRNAIVLLIVTIVQPAYGQITRYQTGPGAVTSSPPPAAVTAQDLSRNLSEIVKGIISVRVDAKFAKRSAEATRCIAACDRYQDAINDVRREISSDGHVSKQGFAEFKEAGRQFHFASRDFYEAVSSKPYQMPEWNVNTGAR